MRDTARPPRAGHRPSPDALLAQARRETPGRGRLKIFLGAAPGVGKTYEMLTTAHARRREGVDVVVGVVETHGRPETEALVAGLEVLARRTVPYGGGTLDEMDLDGLLARKPRLALVDELAHTNAPGSRHPKRYLDVEELLQAGIDVHTTLNIQHVESLNDVVAQITRIRVRETVPDSILDRADDIEVIDLSPDDLIRRLQEGKVYLPRQAERALKHYFSPGNLTALRELALRRTAQQVDDQLVTHMRAHAIPGPWAAGERVLVCVSEDPRSGSLVRYAKRLADRLRAPFTALTIESRRSASLSDAERDRIAETLRLAERLGAETATLPSQGRIADDVIGFAREHNVTHVVVGKSARSRWFELLHGSVVHDLLRRSGPISVHVVA
ncbi:universal stress protein, partial [Methylobacterium aquaticum]